MALAIVGFASVGFAAVSFGGCAAEPADSPASDSAPVGGGAPAATRGDVDRRGSAPPSDSAGSIRRLDEELWALLAAHRAETGLSALQREASLDALAAEHSAAMLASSQLSHDGSAHRFSRMREVLGALSTAENVAMACGHGERSAQVLYRGWRESAGHRKNLEGDYDQSGLAVATDGECAYATQLFGRSR